MSARRLALRRWAHLFLVIATTGAALWLLWLMLRVDGLNLLEWLLLGPFTLLFGWIASSFWLVCAGALAILRGRAVPPLAPAPGERPADAPPTAIVMPIYNEDPDEVFAGLQATLESLREAGALDRFETYVLSDTTDPARHGPEEAAWRRLRRAMPEAVIYYRRRERNIARKSGNIADFCVNWGPLYENMVVLDADSLMTGHTLVAMADLMAANPRVGLIQAPPTLIGGDSLFARLQQFASSVYGPVFATGLACLQGPDGNYWGHNAIIRIAPFMRHCGLPELPGRAPLGGEILSHDFVEAAMLRRAGWEVWLVSQLAGSYEEVPPSLLDFLKRDRRWCQGNVQHLRVMLARGLRLPSRLHMAVGAMGYLASPFWLLLMIGYALAVAPQADTLTVAYDGPYPVLVWPNPHADAAGGLLIAALVLLFAPKLMAVGCLLRDRAALRAHGGVLRLTAGVVLESIVSTLTAPVMMLSHTWFLIDIVLGRATGWGGQQRGGEGVHIILAARNFAPHTVLALIAGAAIWFHAPGALWWYGPVLGGLLLAILLCRLTSIPSWGRAARRWGLFLVPSETVGLPVLERAQALAGDHAAQGSVPVEADLPAADTARA